MQPLRTGNEVKYYIDARSAYEDMTDAMDTATGSAHFIYMLNWFVDEDFELRADVPPSSGPGAQFSTLRLKWTQAAAKKVMIRAMFWDQQLNIANSQNNKEVATINGLATGAAILDGRGNETILQNSPIPIPLLNLLPLHVGSQHQKILCIFGEQGLIAFCGGVDFNPDRVPSPSPTHGSPLHDVHCRIRGPAALDLLLVFTQRWNDHPEGQIHNRTPSLGGKGPLITMASAPAAAG